MTQQSHFSLDTKIRRHAVDTLRKLRELVIEKANGSTPETRPINDFNDSLIATVAAAMGGIVTASDWAKALSHLQEQCKQIAADASLDVAVQREARLVAEKDSQWYGMMTVSMRFFMQTLVQGHFYVVDTASISGATLEELPGAKRIDVVLPLATH